MIAELLETEMSPSREVSPSREESLDMPRWPVLEELLDRDESPKRGESLKRGESVDMPRWPGSCILDSWPAMHWSIGANVRSQGSGSYEDVVGGNLAMLYYYQGPPKICFR